MDIGNDLNAELSRVVSELEDAIGETRKLSADPVETQPEPEVKAKDTVDAACLKPTY